MYSTGEYLDILVSSVSSITLDDQISIAKKERDRVHNAQEAALISGSTAVSIPPTIPTPMLLPVWKGRLDIVSGIEPIYHSTIVGKLKKIAKLE